MKYCKYCGSELSDSAVFCKNCGKKMEKNNVSERSTYEGSEFDSDFVADMSQKINKGVQDASEKTKEKIKIGTMNAEDNNKNRFQEYILNIAI